MADPAAGIRPRLNQNGVAGIDVIDGVLKRTPGLGLRSRVRISSRARDVERIRPCNTVHTQGAGGRDQRKQECFHARLHARSTRRGKLTGEELEAMPHIDLELPSNQDSLSELGSAALVFADRLSVKGASPTMKYRPTLPQIAVFLLMLLAA